MSTVPSFLEKTPTPRHIQRLYHGRNILVWEGKVKVAAVEGWVNNPRIELSRRERKNQVGNRELTQEEVFDLMKNDSDVKLKELRDDILTNGLREPIVLTFTGKLLDGNRRFFSVKYALETLKSNDPRREVLDKIDAFVLDEECTEEDERKVLVEENFAPSLKLEWPDYVKATYVKKDFEDGLSKDDIALKYRWPKNKVRETIRIWEIIDEFLSFAQASPDPEDEFGGGMGLSEIQSEGIAAKNYQFFNEAQKSFFDELKSDYAFKTYFFKWIRENKFSSFPEVRIAYRAWCNDEARKTLLRPDPGAAKDAKAIIDYETRVVRGVDEATARIDSFIKFLRELKADEIASMSDKTKETLQEALKLIIDMANVK